jgi:cytochrome c oxidase subunit 2
MLSCAGRNRAAFGLPGRARLGESGGGVMRVSRILSWVPTAVLAGAALLSAGEALAATGLPHEWQLGFQTPASPVKEQIESLHNWLLVLITLITLFVLGLLGIVIVRFNARANPVPSRTTHNTLIEIIWTVVPVMILVVMAVPSFRLLYYLDRAPNADMTIKVTGHQWYWSYNYPDQENFGFDSYLVAEKDLKPGQPRLLTVDNELVLPAETTVRVLVTSTDVMHSWLVPSLGVQMYAIPGRINETWVRVNEPGMYYGQCNQICGVNHGFMPITVRALSKADFEKWVGDAKKKFAANDGDAALRVAAGQ